MIDRCVEWQPWSRGGRGGGVSIAFGSEVISGTGATPSSAALPTAPGLKVTRKRNDAPGITCTPVTGARHIGLSFLTA